MSFTEQANNFNAHGTTGVNGIDLEIETLKYF
jgi:hypothetical protein